MIVRVRAGQYFTALIFLVSLSCLLTVVIAYVHWLGEEQIEVKRFMRRTILRTLGPVLVPQHFKNLDRVRPPASSTTLHIYIYAFIHAHTKTHTHTHIHTYTLHFTRLSSTHAHGPLLHK